MVVSDVCGFGDGGVGARYWTVLGRVVRDKNIVNGKTNSFASEEELFVEHTFTEDFACLSGFELNSSLTYCTIEDSASMNVYNI